jgi:hypothetical protein
MASSSEITKGRKDMGALGTAQILRPSTFVNAAPSQRLALGRPEEHRQTSNAEGQGNANNTVTKKSTTMDESSRSMAEHIIQTISDRFERRLTEEISQVDRRLTEETTRIDRRLTEEISGVRTEMQGIRSEVRGEIQEVRVEMHKGFCDLRAEIASGMNKATRWAVLLWVTQIGAMSGLLSYLR